MKKLVCPVVLALVVACGQAVVPPEVPRAAGPKDDPVLAAMPVAKASSREVEAPLSLTASDGTGLALTSLDARAVVDGPLAFTEMRMAFANPLDRTLEGTFRITLPQGASLGRFAMKIDGAWQEGEVVELEAARRAYEDFLHRKQDPALLEKAAGNEFSARVFPIPARGVKEIVISYVHEVESGKPFAIPLSGLPALGELTAKVNLVGAKTQPSPLFAKNTKPSDFVVDPASFGIPKDVTSGVRSGELAILRVKPQTDAKPEPLTDAIVLVDTSASRALGFEEEVKLVDRLVKSIAGNVTVACFDQGVVSVYEGKGAGFDGAALARIRDRGALGASDLGKALGWAKEHAKLKGEKRVVLVSDGVATAGDADAKKLATDVDHLKDGGIERLDAIGVGGIRDDQALARLVRGHLPKDGVVAQADGDWSKRLGEATRSGVAVKIEGATWSWPTKLDGVQAGDSYAIYAEIPNDKPIRVAVDGQAAKVVDVRATERPLVERAVAQAKIGSMLEQEATAKTSLKKAITEIAVKNRIMTPYTAMLVLETEQDYARFHIDRKSLVDVMAIEDGKVRRVHRATVALPIAVAEKQGELKEEMHKKLETLGELGAPSDKAEYAGGATSPRPMRPAAPARTEAPKIAESSADRKPVANDAPASPASRGAATTGRLAPSPEPQAPRQPMAEAPPPPAARVAPNMRPRPAPQESFNDRDGVADEEDSRRDSKPPYEGKFAAVMERIAAKHPVDALAAAKAWRSEQPGDVLALVALGEAAEANGLLELAGRAYGSIVDLFPNRADLRRFAGGRLERLADGAALDLAIDSFTKALADRPDHPSSHRLLAFSLLRKKEYAKAFEVATNAIKRGYEVDRFAGVDRILREDIGLVGAVWAKAEPARQGEITKRIRESGGKLEDEPTLRFVLSWETDANDVDFHIHDAKGNHAYYSSPHLRSGGDLYADVTTGYGPECFTVRGNKKGRAGPYKLEAHYYSRGPMGYGMGKLEVIDHDGKGNITFEERPFVVMVDQAFVDLGVVR